MIVIKRRNFETFILLSLLLIGGNNRLWGQDTTVIDSTCRVSIPTITLDSIMQWEEETEGTLLINFWATWCSPCVKELPTFSAVGTADTTLTIKMVSLDRVRDITNATKCLEKNGSNLKGYLMTDTNFNTWLPKINAEWSGDIPATLIINKELGYREFFAGLLEYKDLTKILKKIKRRL